MASFIENVKGIKSALATGGFESEYSHDNVMRLENTGKWVMHADCSGFVLYIFHISGLFGMVDEIYSFIRNVRKVAPEDIKRIWTYDFYNLFDRISDGRVSSDNFQVVGKVEDIMEGDIVVYVPPKETNRLYGHIGIVSGGPVTSNEGDTIGFDILHSHGKAGKVLVSKLYLTGIDGVNAKVHYDYYTEQRPMRFMIARLKRGL